MAGATDKGPTSGGVPIATRAWPAGVWVETISTLTTFGWGRAHGSAGGKARVGQPTKELNRMACLRDLNEEAAPDFAQVQNLGPDKKSGAR